MLSFLFRCGIVKESRETKQPEDKQTLNNKRMDAPVDWSKHSRMTIKKRTQLGTPNCSVLGTDTMKL